MAVRSGDAAAHRRHKAQNPQSIPQYHSSSPTSGSKLTNGKTKKSIGVFFSTNCRRFRQSLNHVVVSQKIQMQLGCLFFVGLFLWIGLHTSVPSSEFTVSASIRSKPRILALESLSDAHALDITKVERWISSEELPYGKKALIFDDDAKFDKYEVTSDETATGCKYIANWQKQSIARPTCNTLHEIGIQVGEPGLMHRLEFIDSGRLKEVWRVFEEDNTPADFVLKTAVFERRFNHRELNYHQKDALVMTEATSNKFVLDMYSYCHYSSIAEAATGTLQSWLKTHRKHLSGLKMLEIAVMIANGVEGTHLYHNGMPTLAHADIKMPQFLLVEHDKETVFKINDFNRGRFLTSNHPPEICPFTISSNHKGSTCRSPEEYENEATQTEKIDVFSTGSMFYHLLTGKDPFKVRQSIENHSLIRGQIVPYFILYLDCLFAQPDPFKDIEFEVAMENIRTGVRPPLPSSIRNSTDPSIAAIVDAMEKCHRFRAEDRPSSKQIAVQLRTALKEILASKAGEKPHSLQLS
jgi:hypothetical protein